MVSTHANNNDVWFICGLVVRILLVDLSFAMTIFAETIFPLPCLGEHSRGGAGLSRGVRQRLGRRAAVQKRANDVIDSLNWLSGCKDSHCEQLGRSRLHDEVLSHVVELVEARVPRDDVPSTEEAARALLRGKFGTTRRPT